VAEKINPPNLRKEAVEDEGSQKFDVGGCRCRNDDSDGRTVFRRTAIATFIEQLLIWQALGKREVLFQLTGGSLKAPDLDLRVSFSTSINWKTQLLRKLNTLRSVLGLIH
jgi:hypothetical protein